MLYKYKSFIKKVGIVLMFIIPIWILSSYVLLSNGMAPWLTVLINVIFGAGICLLAFFIFDILEKRKIEKQKNNPPKDPFAD